MMITHMSHAVRTMSIRQQYISLKLNNINHLKTQQPAEIKIRFLQAVLHI